MGNTTEIKSYNECVFQITDAGHTSRRTYYYIIISYGIERARITGVCTATMCVCVGNE